MRFFRRWNDCLFNRFHSLAQWTSPSSFYNAQRQYPYRVSVLFIQHRYPHQYLAQYPCLQFHRRTPCPNPQSGAWKEQGNTCRFMVALCFHHPLYGIFKTALHVRCTYCIRHGSCHVCGRISGGYCWISAGRPYTQTPQSTQGLAPFVPAKCFHKPKSRQNLTSVCFFLIKIKESSADLITFHGNLPSAPARQIHTLSQKTVS